jgi:heme-degrading monooxygenase HmoA
MIQEVAHIDIRRGEGEVFERAVREAGPIFRTAKGCRSAYLARSVENPDRYLLFVEWERLEDHIQTFWSSDGFRQWRELVGSFFQSVPAVDHVETAVPIFTPDKARADHPDLYR